MPYIIRYIDDCGQVLPDKEMLVPHANHCVEIFGIWPENISFVQDGADVVILNSETEIVRLLEAVTIFASGLVNFSVLVATGGTQRRFSVQAILRLVSDQSVKERGLNGGEPLFQTLTPRETECLTWLANGLKTRLISYLLEVTDSTVNMHITSAKQKLKASTREEAVAKAVKLRLVHIEL
jgi:DNA-binding CsgD family transcriptional regulator